MNQTPSEMIARERARRGEDLVILAHHYMSDEVIAHADLRGDSLELARQATDVAATHIVFCGVTFMAETAAILAAEHQKVYPSEAMAACSMADMAYGDELSRLLDQFDEAGRKVIPLTYVNSSAAIKAVCGQRGGAVCTSANAVKMMKWAFEQGDGVIFLPDRNLAHNAANAVGVHRDERVVVEPDAPLEAAAVDAAKLFIWPGLCVIHHRMRPSHIRAMREEYPEASVIVHPECPPDVVEMADAAGSTRTIIEFVDSAPDGATIVVGTEINLVNRLAREYVGRKTVVPLLESCCPDMGRTTEPVLAALLTNLEQTEPMRVPQDVAEGARVAVERMLALS
jgi:quinolinate synthase